MRSHSFEVGVPAAGGMMIEQDARSAEAANRMKASDLSRVKKAQVFSPISCVLRETFDYVMLSPARRLQRVSMSTSLFVSMFALPLPFELVVQIDDLGYKRHC